MENQLSFLLADDHDTILSGLKYELKDKFTNPKITTTENPQKALEATRNIFFDFAIIDISFRNQLNTDGIELCRKIRIIQPKIKLISYTSYADSTHYINQLQKIGVEAIVSKNDGNFALIFAISEILLGNIPAHSREVYATIVKNEERKKQNNFLLSPREKEILILIHKYLSYPQIAEKLSVSINTVTSHAKNLHCKCKVRKKQELIEKTKNIIDLL